jgi:CoA:oxalate CoA-transferase
MFVGVEHLIAGKMKISGSHIELSNAKQKIRNIAILLGQRTEEVLYKLLSLSKKEIDTLCNNKAM